MHVSSAFLRVPARFLRRFCHVRNAGSVVHAACLWSPGGLQVSRWLPCAFVGRLGRLGGGWGGHPLAAHVARGGCAA